MKVLLTGASSFTGYHFASAMAAAGHEMTCVFTGQEPDYSGIRGLRVKGLLAVAKPAFGVRFGDDTYLGLVASGGFQLLCCHGAYMDNYRSPDFDFERAISQDTQNLAKVFQAAAGNGVAGVVYTGSVFEPGEGCGSEALRAVSVYGATKGAVYEYFRVFAETHQVPLAKFVIPNPFGTFEEPKLPSYLMKMWRSGQKPEIKTPTYVRDNVHADLLAKCYLRWCEGFVAHPEHGASVHPSGYIESQGAFVRRMADEMRARLGWACEAAFAHQVTFPEPRIRVNVDAAEAISEDWSETAAWDSIAEYYSEHLGLY